MNTSLPAVHLTIIQPPGYVHSLGLLDQARYFRWQFRRHGAEVTIAKNRLRHDAVNFVFGAHLGLDPDLLRRHSVILVNLEQLGEGGAAVSPAYLDLLRRSAVVDYDADNVAAYAADAADVPIVPFGYAPYLDAGSETIALEDRPIDLLFFGSLNARRQAFLAKVEALGHQIAVFDSPLYGRERDDFIRRAKSVLNCHFYESSRFEQVRISHCLSLGTPVISERTPRTRPPADFEHSVLWLETDQELEQFFREDFATPAYFDVARGALERFRSADPREPYADLLAFACGYHRTLGERREPMLWTPRRLVAVHGDGYRSGWLNVASHEELEADLSWDLQQPLRLPLRTNTRDGEPLQVEAGGLQRIELDASALHPQACATVLRHATLLLAPGGVLALARAVEAAWRPLAEAWWRFTDGDFALRPLPAGEDGLLCFEKSPLSARECTLARMKRDDFGGLPEDRTADTPAPTAAPRPEPEITVLCVSYRRYDHIPILIHSFLTQTRQTWKLLILHDGHDARMEALLARYKAEHPDRIDYRFTEQRYNDYGHTLRDIGIRMVDTEYLLITNDDNYYCPRFLELMLPDMKRHDADIALCNMIHSHERPGMRPQPSYMPFETRPERGSVDIGSFIARTAWAQRVGFRDKSHDGDATYFEDLLRCAERPKVLKVDRTLFVHN